MKNKNKDRKAQSGAEFIAYVSITMFALTMLTTAISTQQEQVHRLEGSKQAQDTLNLMEENLHIATINQEEYSRTFNLPRDINNEQYNLTITPGDHNGYIAVAWGPTEEQIAIEPTKYNPPSDIKLNSQNGREITVKHKATGVEIEQN